MPVKHRPETAVPGWCVLSTYFPDRHGREVHPVCPVMAIFEPTQAKIIKILDKSGPVLPCVETVYTRKTLSEPYYFRTSWISHLAWSLFDNQKDAENYAARRDLYIAIRPLAAKLSGAESAAHGALSKCDLSQLRQLKAILEDPAGILTKEAPNHE